MHGEEVAALDEVLPADLAHRIGQTGEFRVVDGPPIGWMRAERDVHAERRCALRGGARDSSEAGEAQRRSRNILTEKQFGLPAGELPGSGELVGFDRAPCGGEDEQHRQIGSRVGEHTRCVADRDAVRGRRRNVDVVVADGVVRDSGQLGRSEQVGVEAVGQLCDHDVEVAGCAGIAQLIGCRLLVGHVHTARSAQRPHPRLGDGVGDQEGGVSHRR